MRKVEERGTRATETVLFRGDDPDCLVAAGLACRVCLSSDVELALQLEPWDDSVHCRCVPCGHERAVALMPEQALRLSLRREGAEEAAPAPRSGLAAIV